MLPGNVPKLIPSISFSKSPQANLTDQRELCCWHTKWRGCRDSSLVRCLPYENEDLDSASQYVESQARQRAHGASTEKAETGGNLKLAASQFSSASELQVDCLNNEDGELLRRLSRLTYGLYMHTGTHGWGGKKLTESTVMC